MTVLNVIPLPPVIRCPVKDLTDCLSQNKRLSMCVLLLLKFFLRGSYQQKSLLRVYLSQPHQVLLLKKTME